jgi:hypothetical protein
MSASAKDPGQAAGGTVKNYPLHERRDIVAHANHCDSGLVDHLRSAFSAATSAAVAMSAAFVPATQSSASF